jgi:MFS family permease
VWSRNGVNSCQAFSQPHDRAAALAPVHGQLAERGPCRAALRGSEPGHIRATARDRAFWRLFAVSAVSLLGSRVSIVAMPLVAITMLHTSAAEVGALTAAGTGASLLAGLPAGAWIDRMRKRRVLMAADFGRAAVMLSIPLAWQLGQLTIGQLYVVAFAQVALQAAMLCSSRSANTNRIPSDLYAQPVPARGPRAGSASRISSTVTAGRRKLTVSARMAAAAPTAWMRYPAIAGATTVAPDSTASSRALPATS